MPQRCPLCTLHVFVANLPPRHQQHNADGTGESKWPQSPLCLCGETPTPSVPSVPLWCTYHPATGNTPGEESMPQRYIPLRPPCRCGTAYNIPRRGAVVKATSLCALRAAVVHLPPCHRKHAGGGKHAAALHPSVLSVSLWCTFGSTTKKNAPPCPHHAASDSTSTSIVRANRRSSGVGSFVPICTVSGPSKGALATTVTRAPGTSPRSARYRNRSAA